ncbi:hypothetical protein BDV98DRAFT_588967 [Pterulicium gracile]|uniref:Uncharacterized protein n=1 Tax=Pterulicium gracile TaxID=1884261 RepID=A0A5C3QXM0_9AGAR|nr:hypothetical protein BDV98DRAFT_588967 [Pterula gracilis]
MASQPAQPPTQGQPYKITHDDIDDDVSVSSEDSEELRLAQEEWDEGLRQLQQLVSALLLPFFGKWLGRKWSYWLFARYQRVGLGASFFGNKLLFASFKQ